MPGIDFEMGLFLPSAADADGWNEMAENEFIPNVCSATAVNCVAAAGAAKWHEAYKTLFDQAHRFGLLPDDRRCAYAMLQEYGFIMQSGAMEGETIGAIYTLLEQKFDTGMLLLVQSGGVDSMPVYPIRRELAEEAQCPGSERRNRWDCPATHFWLRWDDGADRSPFPQRTRLGAAAQSARKAAEKNARLLETRNRPGEY